MMFKHIFLKFALTILWLLIFFKGYFPVNHYEAPSIKPPVSINSHDVNVSHLYKPSFDRLILVVIDALREDFVNENYMPYTYKEKSCLIPIKVEAPTVTLPRVKAITIGSIPQFVDIIINLGSPTKVDDSFLHRAHDVGKKMVFYGDETWLKIYPDLFIRKEGTTSFYVNDFKEVDDNVTRHIDKEMRNDDWDMLFLHYLGLDHIGHVKGPFSDLIKPKLYEMDLVVQSLNEAAKAWKRNTLILITGDHGMKDSGGHGGNSYAETHVPLVAFGSTCGDQLLSQQTDIPTTLSALFGLQMHSVGIGKVIPDFFISYDTDKLLYILYYNLLVLSVRSNNCDGFDELTRKHAEFLKKYDSGTANYLLDSYQNCLNVISKKLIKSSVEQDVNLIRFSLIMTVICLILLIEDYSQSSLNKLGGYKSTIYLYTVTIAFIGFYKFYISPVMYVIFQSILIILIINKLIKNIILCFKHSFHMKPYIILVFVHTILLQSSSFIEEEHQIWYYYTATVSVVLFFSHISKSYTLRPFIILTIIATFRFLRTLNSIGDKWGSYPDVADWFLNDSNFLYYQLFYIFGLFLTYISLNQISKVGNTEKILYALTLILTFIYRMYYSNVNLAKGIWFLIIITSFRVFLLRHTLPIKLTITWVLIITLLLRPYNVVLVPCCILYSYFFTKYIKEIHVLTVIHMWLGFTLFFCQGHSNSIASVDISSAYIGLSSYIPVLVFFLTVCHTFAFPILSSLILLTKHPTRVNDIFATNIINRLWILIMIYVVALVQRTHLFVWSVFAPKLLIEAMHTLVLFLYLCTYYLLKFLFKLSIKCNK